MTLIEMIEEHEQNFVLIKKRFYYLENILEELDKTTKSKVFNIRGDIIYQMLRDSYHMLVIDMASLARGMIRKRGFFRRLPNYISELKKPTKKSVSKSYIKTYPSTDPIAESMILKNTLDAFQELFPSCVKENRNKPNKRDIDELKDRFYKICEEIIEDRDRNRAHKYEKAETGKGDVELLSLLDLEKKFKLIEELMNNLRMVCSFTSYGTNDLNFGNSERMAQSIVDLVLIGDYNTIDVSFGISDDLFKAVKKFPYQYREPYYEKLHDAHNKKIEEAFKIREEKGDSGKEVAALPLNFEIFIKEKHNDD